MIRNFMIFVAELPCKMPYTEPGKASSISTENSGHIIKPTRNVVYYPLNNMI